MAWNPVRSRRERKQRELAELEAFRWGRRLADEDVTVFGEQLAELHVETMTSELDDHMRRDYQRALDCYETAKSQLQRATTPEHVAALDQMLTDGRFLLACVLARRDGVELPTRREPCFFNPQHGPGVTDASWTPPGGVERSIPVCRLDANRLSAGLEPEVRLVRVGDRYVPWYAAGRTLSDAIMHHAHVIRGSTSLTDKHIAEAHMRAGVNRMEGWYGR